MMIQDTQGNGQKAYEITSIRNGISRSGSISISVDMRKKERMFPQPFKRVRESMNLERVGPGGYPVQVTCNGATVLMTKITLRADIQLAAPGSHIAPWRGISAL